MWSWGKPRALSRYSVTEPSKVSFYVFIFAILPQFPEYLRLQVCTIIPDFNGPVAGVG